MVNYGRCFFSNWWFLNPTQKHATLKFDHFSNFRGELFTNLTTTYTDFPLPVLSRVPITPLLCGQLPQLNPFNKAIYNWLVRTTPNQLLICPDKVFFCLVWIPSKLAYRQQSCHAKPPGGLQNSERNRFRSAFEGTL